jgi:Lrp/AsnC family leucine-responsive transcriptional regulator
MDGIDRRLIDLLQRNASLSSSELASAIALTVSSVHARVKKLERSGIIIGYVALVDPAKLGKDLLAMMRLSFGSTESGALELIKSRLRELCASEPGILECHNVAGEDCYVLKLRAAGPEELEGLMTRVRICSRASRSVTNIALSTYKESAFVSPATDGSTSVALASSQAAIGERGASGKGAS